MRVLYVEDDDNLAFAVEQMLRQEGHACDRARSGVGAIKLGQEHDYDVILLDVMLPDIDGYEVLRQLQELGVETPVLIQSGLVERDRAMDGLGFGVDDYLIKPFNRDELIRRVEQAATRSGAPASPDIIKAQPVPDPPQVADASKAPEVIALPPAAPIKAPEPPAPEAAPAFDVPAAPVVSETPAVESPPLPNDCPALSARIVAASSHAVIDCTIVTVASGGAVLDVYNETVECPDEFLLAVTGDKSYRCESCWRHGGKLGVKFV